MALKPIVSICAVGAACVALAVAFLPPSVLKLDVRPETTSRAAQAERGRLLRELTRTLGHLRAELDRDSILAALHTSRADAVAPALLVGSDLSTPMQTRVSAIVEQHWQRLGIDSARFPVAVRIVADTAIAVRLAPLYTAASRHQHLLSIEAGDGRSACVSILRLRSWSASPLSTVSAVRGQYNDGSSRGVSIAGPCAFYAAFGKPGPRIFDWLDAREFDLAMNSDWSVSEVPVSPQRPGLSFFGGGVLNGSITMRRCLLGNTSACEAAILDENLPRSSSTRVPKVYDATSWVSSRGGVSRRFLADLNRTMGSERFAMFWKSEDEPRVAFERAMGTTLGEYTRDWAREKYGHTTSGAKVSTLAVLLGVLVGLGGVGVAAVVAGRRAVV